jgi:hypothetical protein
MLSGHNFAIGCPWADVGICPLDKQQMGPVIYKIRSTGFLQSRVMAIIKKCLREEDCAHGNE